MSSDRWTPLTTMYLAIQVLCIVLHLTPLTAIIVWRKHAYIQRLHMKLMVIRGHLMALFCSYLIHEFPVWRKQGALDPPAHGGCWPLWITGHFAFSTALIAEVFSLVHMWLIYMVDYLQSSTAFVMACEYHDGNGIALTKTISGRRDRLSSSHTFASNPPAVMTALSLSYTLGSVSSLLARISLWIFDTPGMQVARDADGEHWVLRSTRPDGHLPVVTVALNFRIRAKLVGVFTWLLVLVTSVGHRRLLSPTSHAHLPSFSEPCTGNDMVGLTYLAVLTTAISFLIVVSTQPYHVRCTEEMRFLRWTCGWRVFLFACLAPCYIATWLNAPGFENAQALFGPWVFPVTWEVGSGVLRSWSPALIVWLQVRRDKEHWANLPETRLRKLLANPEGSDAFGEFCGRQHCSEAYQFCLDYQRLIIAPGASQLGIMGHVSPLSARPILLTPLVGDFTTISMERTASNAVSSPRPAARDNSPISALPLQTLDQREPRSCTNDNPQQLRIDVAIPISAVEAEPPRTSCPQRITTATATATVISPFLDMGTGDEVAHSSLPLPPSTLDPLDVRLRYFAMQYIEQGSPKEVNISAASRQRFIQALQDARCLLDATSSLTAINDHVFRVMLDGVFARFCEEQHRRAQSRRGWLWKLLQVK